MENKMYRKNEILYYFYINLDNAHLCPIFSFFLMFFFNMCTIWKIVLVPIFGTGAMATCDPRVTYIHMNKTFCQDNV